MSDRCPDCNGELSAIGESSIDGIPTMDCRVCQLTAHLAAANEQILRDGREIEGLLRRSIDAEVKLTAANKRAEAAINPPAVYIPDTTDTDPEVHQDIACVEWHEGGVTHSFSAEGGEVIYLKMGPGEELVSVKWTDPVVTAANEQINEYATAMFEAGVAYGKLVQQLTARDAEIVRLEKQSVATCEEVCSQVRAACAVAGHGWSVCMSITAAIREGAEAARKEPK